VILDLGRFKNLLKTLDLLEDFRDTIEWLLSQKEEFDLEWQAWVEEDAAYKKQIETFESDIKQLKAEIYDLKQKAAGPKNSPPSSPPSSSSPEERIIVSRYSGRCSDCGFEYAVGERIRWTPGVKGAKHQECPK